ncbi:hypothetical protein [Neorhizobium galegae]|uniref:hypothetical protein n=1 Tax=Neorhizobium galegae TaxID=399 RepID=UPI002101FE5A|nr:hypothetical protein [Neorhizobium galegae]MCQ1838427.1 hypothetical protein [Neorhizobium galegae]
MASSGNKDVSFGTTRRNFLSHAAASIAAASVRAGAVVRTERSGQGDPVVSLWRDWMVAHRLCGEACRRQQKLETELLRQFGSFPRTKAPLSEDCGFMWAYSGREIDRLLPNADQDEMRRRARAALAARRSEWKTADKRVGYTRAKKAEKEIADVEEALAQELWSAAPRSVAGVAVKLHSLLEMEDPRSALQEAPWPELRTILADLVRISAGPNAV